MEEKKEDTEQIRRRGTADQAADRGMNYKPNWKYLSSVTSKYECRTISPHVHRITDLSISSDDQYLFSTSHDSTLSVYSLPEQRVLRSVKISHLALSSCCTPFDFKSFPLCIIGSWDNNIYIYNNDRNKVHQILKSHSDAVSCLAPSTSGVTSGSWDNTVKVWQYKGTEGLHPKALRDYKIDCEVRCVSNCYVQPNISIVGDECGSIHMFDTRNNGSKYVRLWERGHKDEV